MSSDCRSLWPRRLNRGSAAARFLELRLGGGGGCLAVLSGDFGPVEVLARRRTLGHRLQTPCGVSKCGLENLGKEEILAHWSCRAMGGENIFRL
jgi:hypothetical protein